MPLDSGYISYKHIKSNIVDELTITSGKGIKYPGYAWGGGMLKLQIDWYITSQCKIRGVLL